MKYNFDSFINRRGTNSLKWDYINSIFNKEDLIPLWVADMDFKCAEPITKAIEERVKHGIFGYTGKPESYYNSIISWMKKRHGWEIKKPWISHSPGIVSAINMCVLAYSNPGDRILVQCPVYYPFFSAIENHGRVLVNSSLKLVNEKYYMDFKDLEDKFKTGIKLMILCNPHNPVGRVWSLEELKLLGDLCVKYDVTIISDEIHSDLIYPFYKHISIASISEELALKTVTCTAPSKTFNIAGLATATLIIPNQELLNKYNTVLNNLGISMCNTFGVTALEAAYTYGEDWLEELLIYLQGNMSFLDHFLKTRIPKIKLIPPEGTYLAWLDCRDLNLNDEELKNFMISKAGVGLNNGLEFGCGGEGFQRMNVACSRRILEQALIKIEQAVNNMD